MIVEALLCPMPLFMHEAVFPSASLPSDYLRLGNWIDRRGGICGCNCCSIAPRGRHRQSILGMFEYRKVVVVGLDIDIDVIAVLYCTVLYK